MVLVIDPLALWKSSVDRANVLGLQIQAAKSDRPAMLKSLIETSDNETVAGYRAGREKLLEQVKTIQDKLASGESKIQEFVSTLLPAGDSNLDIEATTKLFVTARGEANSARKALLNFVSEEDLDAAAKEMGIVEVVTIRGTKSGHGAGVVGNVKRPRISAATIDGESVWKDEAAQKVDFTHLAKILKLNAESVKAAAFVAGGTNDLNTLTPGTVVSFKVENNNVTVTISASKPGRKKSEVAAETVEVTE